MLTELSFLRQAENTAIAKSDWPKAKLVVKALLEAEKREKKEKSARSCHSFNDLIGEWNLRFITGTKKTRKKAGIILGSGKYIPWLVKIKITYLQEQSQKPNTGKVINSVSLGFFNLSLTGPVKFIEQKNILAFDFNAMVISVFGWKIYDGYLKKKINKEAEFYRAKTGELAFFSYFIITDDLIAARGKGGGLGLWTRDLKSLTAKNK